MIRALVFFAPGEHSQEIAKFRIMAPRFIHRLSLTRMLLIAAAAFASVAGPIVLGIASAPRLRAQSAAPLAFEVAAIKPFRPTTGDPQYTGFHILGGGRFTTTNTSLRMLITFAYNVKDYQLSGSPSWTNSETYDITAKAADNAPLAQLRLMLQTLLKERFKLALRHETKDVPIYELVVAKGGSKIQEDATSSQGMTVMTGKGKVTVQKALLANFAQMLATITGRPVVDKTGLQSRYSFKLDWTPDPGEGGLQGPDGRDAAPPDPNGPSLFTALQEQLGLRLQSANGPVEYLVIEEAERPSEN